MRRYLYILFLWTCTVNAQFNSRVLGALPDEVKETSGLVFTENRMFTHNDSGNQPIIYEVDTTSMTVVREIRITNSENTDWEDMALDDKYVYIGDIGNTRGNRQDLVVYRVSLTDMLNKSEVVAESIRFTYEDQQSYEEQGTSDWDAEALTVVGDSLLIFTKQWKSENTVVYSIPKLPGNYLALRKAEFAVSGLVTGATYDLLDQRILLSGYSELLQPFLIEIPHELSAPDLNPVFQKTILPFGLAQIEAITKAGPNSFLLSSEVFKHPSLPVELAAGLYRIDFQETGANSEDDQDEGDPDNIPIPGNEDELVLFGEPQTGILHYALNRPENLVALAVYDTSGKQVFFDLNGPQQEFALDLSLYNSAVYYFTFYFKDKIISKPYLVH